MFLNNVSDNKNIARFNVPRFYDTCHEPEINDAYLHYIFVSNVEGITN
jgi:hypothetical protein